MSLPTENTSALVLRTRPIRESDLMVVLLSARFGKIEALARGARRSKKRFPGGLPMGARGEALLAQGRGGISRLDGFQMQANHLDLGRDLDRFAYVAYICELTELLISGSQPDPVLFDRVSEAVDSVLDGDGPPTPFILRRIELCVLENLGLLPSLVRCSVCGLDVFPKSSSVSGVPFVVDRGGAFCEEHGSGAPRIASVVLRIAADLVSSAAAGLSGEVSESDVSREDRRALRDLSVSMVNTHLPRPLKSLSFFSMLGTPSAKS